jgi:hypothetical protein
MTQTKREQLISEIEAFCVLKALSERQFSDVATRNAKFMVRLRANAVASRTMEHAEQFMREHHDSSPALLAKLVKARRGQRPTATDAPQTPDIEMRTESYWHDIPAGHVAG